MFSFYLGLVALITLNLGYQYGLVTPRLFSMLIVFIVVNTLLSCPLVALVKAINNRCSKKKKIKMKNKIEKPKTKVHPLNILVCSFHTKMTTIGRIQSESVLN
jgi:hypothetical protein